MNPNLVSRLMGHLQTAVVLVDEHLRIIFMNPSAEALLQQSENRCLGNPLIHYLLAPGDIHDQIRFALQYQQPYTAREIELDIYPDFQITVDLTINPLNEPGQQHVLLEFIPLDRRLRLSRDEQQLSVHQTNRQLIRGMAHEIKNPLGGIRGAAQLLEGELEQPDLQEYTQIIIGEVDRLQILVDKLLGPRSLPKLEATNIHEILEHVRQLITVEAGDNITIQTYYDPSLPELMADRDMLVQAILNIARNAMLALADVPEAQLTFRTAIQTRFTIGQNKHKLVIQVSIIDNGPGIPEEMRDSLFFPMVTTRPGGSGLGLSIAQSLINQHEGLIEFQSRPGDTQFHIFLPVFADKANT